MRFGSSPSKVPPTSHARGVRLALVAFLGLVALVAPAASDAQYFGQNKVQYKSFHWEVLRTEHFDVHYYRGEEEAVQDAAVMAERSYRRLSRVLDHQIKSKIPLVLYASHTDFEQTNITPELLGVGSTRRLSAVRWRMQRPGLRPIIMA